MNRTLREELAVSLEQLRSDGKFKTLRYLEGPMGPEVEMEEIGKVLCLCSNDYLGLANHPRVVEAGKKGLEAYGAGTASVRFICGTLRAHREIETALARFHKTEAAVTYVSCWAANTGVVPTLVGPEDIVISDELNHASLIDACRLASKTPRAIYKHGDMGDLKEKLAGAAKVRRKLVLTDGVFSMEGDLAKLPDILELAKRYGAIVLMDDSHGVGVLGKRGRGTAEHFGVEGEVDIITGTLGKALGGAAGGYAAGPAEVVETLVQSSRPQIFSNALPATVACSALEALRVLDAEPERVAKLHRNAEYFREGLKRMGFKPLESPSAIIPIIVGETAFAIRMSGELLREGVYVIGFGYPVVPEGAARVRVQISAALERDHMDRALDAFGRVGKRLGLIR